MAQHGLPFKAKLSTVVGAWEFVFVFVCVAHLLTYAATLSTRVES